MDQTKIGQYIADKRKALGMTQEQLAEKLNKSQKSVSKWERGVCLPDVSVYTELCDILGITLNEFFAGEDIEPVDVAALSERNLIGVVTDSKKKTGRFKRIVILIAIIALILALVLGYVMNKEGYFLKNYIKSYDRESEEYNTATMFFVPGEANLFKYSVDKSFRRMTIKVYEYEQGRLVSAASDFCIDFSDNGEEVQGKGAIAVLQDYHNHKMRLVGSNDYFRGSAEIEIGTSIKDLDMMGMAWSVSDIIKGIKPNKEYPICGYYFGDGELSAIIPEEFFESSSENPSKGDYNIVVTVSFSEARAVNEEKLLRAMIEYPNEDLYDPVALTLGLGTEPSEEEYTAAQKRSVEEKEAWTEAVGDIFAGDMFENFYENWARTHILGLAWSADLTTSMTDFKVEDSDDSDNLEHLFATVEAKKPNGATQTFEMEWMVWFDRNDKSLLQKIELIDDGGFYDIITSELNNELDLTTGLSVSQDKTGRKTLDTEYFTLTLNNGDTWDYEVLENTAIIIYNIRAHETDLGGRIMTIEALDINDSSYQDGGGYKVIGLIDKNRIVVVYASDIQYDINDKDAADEYMKIRNEAETIQKGGKSGPLILK